jgi:cell division protein ZapE
MPVITSLEGAYEARLGSGWQEDATQLTAIRSMNRILGALSRPGTKPIKGLYMHGPVGRGKTQLLNMFMEHLDPAKALRTHMHSFIAETNQRFFEIKSGDPVVQTAREMSERYRVLGFDEFYVSNIADGMLLGRLFQHLFLRGVVVVATSNWPMDELYRDGRNRKSFVPFIRVLASNMESIDLGDGQDYRQSEENRWPLYFVVSEGAPSPGSELTHLFEAYAGTEASNPPEAMVAKAYRGRCGWYEFEELLERPVGRREYLDLVSRIDTLIVEGIPVFTPARTESALRLVTLIDVCYEHRCRVVITATAYPEELCEIETVTPAFRRAASRLAEMQSWV